MGSRSKRIRRTRSRRAWFLLGLGIVGFWTLHRLGYLDTTVANDEALARAIRSEIGNGTKKQKTHVAWAIRNLARSRKQSISKMVCSPCGRQQQGRPVSSRQPARDSDRVIARSVLASSSTKDPTGGATHFISPRTQDRLARVGTKRGYRGNTYRRVRRRWQRSYGLEPYYRLGHNLEFWGAKRSRQYSKRRR